MTHILCKRQQDLYLTKFSDLENKFLKKRSYISIKSLNKKKKNTSFLIFLKSYWSLQRLKKKRFRTKIEKNELDSNNIFE